MEYTIRSMRVEDIPQVQHVAKTTWNYTYEGIIPSEIQKRFLESAYNYEMMNRRLNGSFMFVSDVQGKIVGFANFSPVKEGGVAELGAIYICPEYHGNGIGTALLNEGIKNIEGATEFYINVEKDNKIGTTFYNAKRFEVVSEFDDDFEGHILKTVRMKLRI
ncbi:GNAT family N-acetyltransferase [Virgibacillus necropolis]|uniref:GNAT family N-acetyltransferase n=1 Tax=Virgibacillus necropolis TaxID=163877 RepID=A0A221MFR8_9BACI|nr:GNAT family N-acetyltransferase [Virgibacillus necropolis]ASN06429.1 GNAT family N-acetyltransferase [Virgibacillus necropolis]